ncbi:hypothetical protein AB0M54_24515 [Actinoplanes sp. NPDC051470]|uniref:hypothetical protein n=1 Tax=Actinoplanes sp. NPDC051470 TaxID=3157224 RepID=UPI003416814D
MSAVDDGVAVAKLLADLGDTADAYADALRAKEIKGQRNKSRCCPIARYIAAAMPNLYNVTVIRKRLYFLVANSPISARVWVPMPVAAEQFTHRFDEGVYLDLVEVA